MTLDRIENLGLYLSGELLSQINVTIKEIKEDIPDGNYPLIENDLYFKVLRYKTKKAEWITESYRKHIDIQIVLTGVELLKTFDIHDLQASHEYDYETDVILYKVENSKAISEIRITRGFFCIFLPNEVHKTQIADINGPQLITKLVFKVHEKFFSQ